MKIHIKILAFLYLLLGAFVLIGFLAANILFFKSDLLQMQSSVLEDSTGFFGKFGQLFNNYLEFFALYGFSGIDLILQILLCALILAFAIGLLKQKSWSKIPGFVIIFLNIISIFLSVFDGYFSASQILTILLVLYTAYVLTSDETKKILN